MPQQYLTDEAEFFVMPRRANSRAASTNITMTPSDRGCHCNRAQVVIGLGTNTHRETAALQDG